MLVRWWFRAKWDEMCEKLSEMCLTLFRNLIIAVIPPFQCLSPSDGRRDETTLKTIGDFTGTVLNVFRSATRTACLV